MNNLYEIFKSNIKKCLIIFFASYFLLGVNIVKDYGISFDEETTRLYGLMNGNYVLKKFLPQEKYDSIFSKITTSKFSNKIKEKQPQEFDNFEDKVYGAIFELPVVAIEIFLNIKDSNDIYFFRHLINFIFFFVSLLFFFKLLNKVFNNKIYSLFGCLILITSPRIFAQSFYNSKDIIFLSFFVISNYYGYSLILKNKIKNLFLFCFFSACLINLRVVGGIVPLTILLIMLFNDIVNKVSVLKKEYIFIPILIVLSLYIIWPYLWDDPINNFINVIKYFSNHPWHLKNFYLGEYVKATEIQWHYLPIWIIVTTPIFFLIITSAGLLLFFVNIKKKFKKIKDIYIFFTLSFYVILPILLAISLGSTLYDGWRHFYFILPFLIFFALYFVDFLFNYKQFKIVRIISIFLFFLFFLNIYHMIRLHPHQYLYFNNFIIKDSLNKFERDYWGLSNKEILNVFLTKTNDDKIVYAFIGSMFPLSIQILNNKDQSRFIDVNKIKKIDNYKGPIYIFVNNRFNPNYELIKNNAETIHELIIDGVIINGVYKFKDLSNYKLTRE